MICGWLSCEKERERGRRLERPWTGMRRKWQGKRRKGQGMKNYMETNEKEGKGCWLFHDGDTTRFREKSGGNLTSNDWIMSCLCVWVLTWYWLRWTYNIYEYSKHRFTDQTWSLHKPEPLKLESFELVVHFLASPARAKEPPLAMWGARNQSFS